MRLTAEQTELFWSKVKKTDHCWLWTAGTQNGYGKFWVASERQNRFAHVVAYKLVIGGIPDGLMLDHTCRVRRCVNPIHLEPVTCKINLLRGETHAAMNTAKTHCPRNHPYDDENTYLHPAGQRYCRMCTRVRQQTAKFDCPYCARIIRRNGRMRHLRRMHPEVIAA